MPTIKRSIGKKNCFLGRKAVKFLRDDFSAHLNENNKLVSKMTSESVLHGWSWEITVISVIGKINSPWKSKGYLFAIQILHSDHAGTCLFENCHNKLFTNFEKYNLKYVLPSSAKLISMQTVK